MMVWNSELVKRADEHVRVHDAKRARPVYADTKINEIWPDTLMIQASADQFGPTHEGMR